MNRYLARRREKMMMRDGRNPYGSRGGYVEPSHRDYVSEHRSGYHHSADMRRMDSRDYMGDQYSREPRGYMEPYGYGVDYRRDYRSDYRGMDGHNYRGMNYEMMHDYPEDYRSGSEDEEYRRDLRKWEEKLKHHDKYGMTKSQVTEQARNYGAKFQEYDEEEFYVTYLMMISDYKELFNDPMVFIKMAKAFLEDKDAEAKGGEKLCTYMYEIALGGK